MRTEFLEKLVKRYPNNYELGNVIRSFWNTKRDNPILSLDELENKFINNFQNVI